MLNIHEVLNNIKVETEEQRLVFRALGMIRERALYWETQYDSQSMASAYESAADILAYAMMGDVAALNQFDYYDESSDGYYNPDGYYDVEKDFMDEWACTPADVNKVCEV